MNAKGVILKAFEQFRLKTCIDFQPRQGFEQHVTLRWGLGCWSEVGRQPKMAQDLAIGTGCDQVATVEHELMHTLGFWHEQSRYDRDNYISINWENIEIDEQDQFQINTKTTNSTMDTPYDYFSVMHYPKDAFSNGKGSTIITKLPEFQDVIGQTLDMSHYDVEELNKFYRCNESISFLDHCSFDDDKSMCDMRLCFRRSQGWRRESRVARGPQSDHTHLDTDSHGTGFFMHFSTKRGRVGHSARLQTRRMTPRRSCKVQCLEFFYYHSGCWSDQLNIWIREFDGVNDTEGTRRLMSRIQGSPADYWQLHHVPLNATKTFQVELEAIKGGGSSKGGFSVDDLNLSETECPHHTWQISNFEEKLNISANNSFILSPKYYSEDGYRYQIMIRLNKDYFGVFVRLVSGINDDTLEWPCDSRQVTVTLLDQNPHIQKRMSKQRSVTTSSSQDLDEFFHKPRTQGTLQTDDSSEDFYTNDGIGDGVFMSATILQSREFMKGGDVFFLVSIQDISKLRNLDSLPCPSISVKNLPGQNNDDHEVPCTTLSSLYKTPHPSTTPCTTASTTREHRIMTPGNPEVTPPDSMLPSTILSPATATTGDHQVMTTGSTDGSGVFSIKTDVSPWVVVTVVLSLIFIICTILGVMYKKACSKINTKSISYQNLLQLEQDHQII
ncbi:meprin A subunit beta-like isoform X2 [Alosa pseudoharengus]